MITVKEAEKIIAGCVRQAEFAESSLEESCGAVLQEDIFSDRDQPPFDKSLMDGIAVNFSAWAEGTRSFKIEGVQAAGQDRNTLKDIRNCYEVMTGAVVPKNCDCVIPVEQVNISDGSAVLKDDVSLKKGQHIREQGSDYKQGDLLIKKGQRLEPVHIAVCAAVGKSKIKVSKKITIAIISTGDEIVDVDAPIKFFQIRKSNEYALKTLFEKEGLFRAEMFHVRDDEKELQNQIKHVLDAFDVIVLSGGVSMGKFDLVPKVLQDLGVEVKFHKIKQRPGKPMWFGLTKENKPVFALPGNPISTQICAYRYVLPYLKQACGLRQIEQCFVKLSKDFTVDVPLTYFLPVTISYNQRGEVLAAPRPVSGSGDFATLSKANGFIELANGNATFETGQCYPFFGW